MELVHRKHKESKFAPQDFISNMPDIVITNILDRLPIQDAVRTTILARNWRFKWTMLSQLVSDDNFLSITKSNQRRVIISRLLLNVRGAITKFSLSLHDDLDEDINHWILFLSSKGIKDLTIRRLDGRLLKLPTHLFSCLELKRLELDDCCFSPPPTFHGFPNLLSLELSLGGENTELGKFITQCPLLEILKLSGNVKLVEIAKLKNLKLLYLQLCDLNDTTIISSYNIFELLGSLPKLQELHLNFTDYKLTQGGAKKKFPSAFPSLKDADPIPIPKVEYNTTGLQRVIFGYFAGSENEMCLIKYLLACSPFLKLLYICPRCRLAPMFTTKLLKLPRASTVAEIDFDYLLV